MPEQLFRRSAGSITRAVLLLVAVSGSRLSAAEPVITADGDDRAPGLLQRVSHAFAQPIWPSQPRYVEPFARPSSYYGPWEPPESFGHDARCAPTPYAPRGYGFPKKLACHRLDYAPYRLSDVHSSHGPTVWLSHHREPCCDASKKHCGVCDRSVAP